MISVKIKVEVLEEKTDYKENNEFKAAVWDQIQEFKADEEEIAFRRTNLIFQGVKEPTAVSPEEKYEEDLSKVQKVAREAGLQEGVVLKPMARLNITGVAR